MPLACRQSGRRKVRGPFRVATRRFRGKLLASLTLFYNQRYMTFPVVNPLASTNTRLDTTHGAVDSQPFALRYFASQHPRDVNPERHRSQRRVAGVNCHRPQVKGFKPFLTNSPVWPSSRIAISERSRESSPRAPCLCTDFLCRPSRPDPSSPFAAGQEPGRLTPMRGDVERQAYLPYRPAGGGVPYGSGD